MFYILRRIIMENLATKKKFGKGKVAIVAAVLAVVLGAGTFGLYAFTGLFGTALTINDAFENFGAELEERLETTPLVAFSRLIDAAHDGVISADVGFSQGSGLLSLNGNVSARLYSQYEQGEYALFLEGGALGINLDARMFIGSNSMAFGSDALLGTDNFGFNFDTFAEDAQSFFNAMDWDIDHVVAELAYLVNELGSLSGSVSDDFDHNYQQYLLFLNNFINDSEQERLQTTVNGISVDRISLKFSNDDLVRFLNDLHEILTEDAQLRAIFDLQDLNNTWMQYSEFNSYDWLLQDLEWLIYDLKDLQDEFLITTNFYIDANGRMVQMYFGVDYLEEQLALTLNTGTHALDTWTLELEFVDGEHNIYTVSAIWTIDYAYGYYNNTIIATHYDLNNGAHDDAITIFSNWNSTTGSMTLGGSFGDEEFSFDEALLFVTYNSMSLYFRDIYIDGISINIEISTITGEPMPSSDFVNISEWTQEMFDDFYQQIQGILSAIDLLSMIF